MAMTVHDHQMCAPDAVQVIEGRWGLSLLNPRCPRDWPPLVHVALGQIRCTGARRTVDGERVFCREPCESTGPESCNACESLTNCSTGPGLCLVILGGTGVNWQPPGLWTTDRPTHPPTHIRKFVLGKKNEIKGARTWRSILGTQTFIGL